MSTWGMVGLVVFTNLVRAADDSGSLFIVEPRKREEKETIAEYLSSIWTPLKTCLYIGPFSWAVMLSHYLCFNLIPMLLLYCESYLRKII